MKQTFKGKTVIVTGGTGSIGSEMVKRLLETDVAQIRVFSRDEHKQHELQNELPKDKRLRWLIGDVRDRDRLDFAFQGADICFHVAALKHVHMCEYNPFEALKTNVIGTQNVIEAARLHNLDKVVAISTDKAVSPESVLGASKLMMERLVTAANISSGKARTRYASVRFGNVLNSRGSVGDIWMRQIQNGGPVTVTDERMVRYFMEIREAVALIFDATDLMHGGEIFVLKMDKRPIVEFAKELIKRHGKGKKISIDYIGVRPGEKLNELLYTTEEESRMLDTGKLYIITPERLMPTKDKKERIYRNAKPIKRKR